ncbi:Membrane protein involved in the export of O-antigen and teichoic acid [Sphingopyxis sp. YR583]|uniref:lipopolysaccharide biosynthesis protein n=1 Tax=Sphingopyxis sp. YR583 TaxID=1881047 RepID=UPI0008A72B91|nr:oligosaccharide flippase family protein [Sphingopyxis sp. YR583]SEH18290.1 Membrane protein involved in the export of O-antigen and teichoic acid [Sphingopyxis sp. YR583]
MSRLSSLFAQAKRSLFVRNVAIMMGGTLIAQAIPVLISPLLTRLYTPAELGIFAVYFSLTMFLAVVATGRYDLAIMLPANRDKGVALTLLSMGLSVVTALLFMVLVFFAGEWMAHGVDAPAMLPWLWLVAPATILMASYVSLTYWLNRQGRYGVMSRNRVMQSTLLAGGQLGMGATMSGPAGLMLGHFVAQLVTTATIFRDFLRQVRRRSLRAWRHDIVAVARRYAHHPKYLLAAHVADKAAIESPTIAIAALYGPREAGFFMMAQRIIALPTSLIANAVGDVYRQNATEAWRRQREFRSLFVRTMLSLAALVVAPLAVVVLIAPEAFALVFGETWRVSGFYAQSLAVAAALQFVLSPLDKGALIVGAVRYISIWEYFRVSLMAAVIAVCAVWKLPAAYFVVGVAFANATVYLVDGFVQWRISGGNSRFAR